MLCVRVVKTATLLTFDPFSDRFFGIFFPGMIIEITCTSYFNILNFVGTAAQNNVKQDLCVIKNYQSFLSH